jgi:hypothetical protein
LRFAGWLWGKGLADTLGLSWARQGNWSFLAAVVLTAATMSLLFAVAVTLSTRQAATVAEVVFLLLLGLWRLRAAVLALLPLPPLGVAVFHSLMPAITAICAVAVTAAFTLLAGRVRLRSPHLWIAGLAGAALAAYLFPQVRYEQPGVPLHALFMAGLGLLAFAVSVMAPPKPGALLRALAVTGALAAWLALTHGEQYALGRAGGLSMNPNYFGAYVSLPIVAALGLALQRRNPLWLAGSGICAAALLATESRGASLSALAGTVFLVLQARSRPVRVLLAVMAAAAAALWLGSLGAITNIGAGDRPAGELVTDTAVRSQVMRFTLHVALSHPLRGIGFSQFSAYAAVSPGLGEYIAATNQYLLLAAEAGLLGLIPLVILIWRGIRPARTGEMAVVRAVAFTYVINMLFMDSLSVLVSIVPFWLCLGLLLSQAEKRDKPVTAGPASQATREVFHARDHCEEQPGKNLRVRQELDFVHRAGR